MDIETLTTINETYRITMMLLQGFTMIVGLASVMFVLVAIVCAVCDCLGKMGHTALHQTKPAKAACAYEATGVLANLECAFDRWRFKRRDVVD